MDLHLEMLDDSELAELVGDGLARLHSRLQDEDTTILAAQRTLAAKVLAFEANGGRGVQAAEEIDRLSKQLDAMVDENQDERCAWIERVCDAWDDGVERINPAAGQTSA